MITLPYIQPPAAAARITKMGDTPMAHIARALAMGIQQLLHPILALRARLKVGTAINATTAGRIPLNMAATQGTSLNCEKNRAMSRMMMKEFRLV